MRAMTTRAIRAQSHPIPPPPPPPPPCFLSRLISAMIPDLRFRASWLVRCVPVLRPHALRSASAGEVGSPRPRRRGLPGSRGVPVPALAGPVPPATPGSPGPVTPGPAPPVHSGGSGQTEESSPSQHGLLRHPHPGGRSRRATRMWCLAADRGPFVRSTHEVADLHDPRVSDEVVHRSELRLRWGPPRSTPGGRGPGRPTLVVTVRPATESAPSDRFRRRGAGVGWFVGSTSPGRSGLGAVVV